ncbi:hypothetical protein Tco_0039148 [Tanacetum coccineum]
MVFGTPVRLLASSKSSQRTLRRKAGCHKAILKKVKYGHDQASMGIEEFLRNCVPQSLPWRKALVGRENVGFDLTKSDLFPSFVKDLTAKGMGLRVVDSHTGNHHEDGFTPLETIRRLLSIIWEKIPFEFEGEAFEPERRVCH